MPESNHVVVRALLRLAVLMTAACAEVPDDPDSYEDDLAFTDATDDAPDVSESALGCNPRRPKVCNVGRATPEENAIWTKLATLPADVRAGYYATQTSGVAQTPDGKAFHQWYQGSLGRGAIYYVKVFDSYSSGVGRKCQFDPGVYALYGGILETWARADYERSPGGYPTADRQGDEQRFGCISNAPSISNGGLVEEAISISDDGNGQGTWNYEPYYMVGRDTNVLSPFRQDCKYVPHFYCLDGRYRYIVEYVAWAPEGMILWCGPENYDSLCGDPRTIDP